MLKYIKQDFIMKEIVLDTSNRHICKEGHRIVEIGCLELDDLIPTKNNFTVI